MEESSDSEEQVKSESRIPAVSEVSPMDQAYVVKRMNASNGSVYYGNDQELHRDSSKNFRLKIIYSVTSILSGEQQAKQAERLV